MVRKFHFNGHCIRVMQLEGQPWFVNEDIQRALGYEPEPSKNIMLVSEAVLGNELAKIDNPAADNLAIFVALVVLPAL